MLWDKIIANTTTQTTNEGGRSKEVSGGSSNTHLSAILHTIARAEQKQPHDCTVISKILHTTRTHVHLYRMVRRLALHSLAHPLVCEITKHKHAAG
jgi:hypothetical protein